MLSADLIAASAAGDIDGVNQLLAVVAPDSCDVAGRTALMHACRAGQVATARLLIEAGADVNAPNINGTTPLMYAKTAAIGSGRLDLLELLVAAGADINARDAVGRTALDYAMTNARLVIDYLTSRGAMR